MSAPLFGLLLSGGESRRMQRDKAALAYRGEPQLLRAWRLLEPNCERRFVSMRAAQQGDGVRDGLPFILDRTESVGPLAGILAAQQAHPEAAWLVIACDLPFLDAETLRTLLSARAPGFDAVAFTSRFDGLPEPLCTIWEPSSRAALEDAFAAKTFCPRRVLADLRTQLLPVPGEALDNINTPGEFADAVQRLGADA